MDGIEGLALVRRRAPSGPQGTEAVDGVHGGARAFTDRRLARGVKYRYTVTAYDQAGTAL